MTRKSIFRKLIFVPLTISVFLLCTGSLINFHQYHIWHKPLLPEFVAYKRDSEKTLDHVSLQNFSHPTPVHFILLDATCSSVLEFRSSFDFVFLTGSITSRFPVLLKPGIHGLRAPPFA
jgi:hypothetical protein